jgi:hypothetical protein
MTFEEYEVNKAMLSSGTSDYYSPNFWPGNTTTTTWDNTSTDTGTSTKILEWERKAREQYYSNIFSDEYVQYLVKTGQLSLPKPPAKIITHPWEIKSKGKLRINERES